MTVQEEITQALKEINILAAGETGTAEDYADAFLACNRMLDQWAAERLQIFSIVRTTWTIVSGTQLYTVGTGGTVNVARPVFLDHVNFVDSSMSPTIELQMQPLTDDAYAGIVQKAATSPYPVAWFYNPAYPLGALTLFPVPTSSTLTGALYAPQAIAQFAALSTTISLAPGYEECLVKNLALKLCPTYGVQPNPLLILQAKEAKEIVKRANKRLSDLTFPADSLIGNNYGAAWSVLTGP